MSDDLLEKLKSFIPFMQNKESDLVSSDTKKVNKMSQNEIDSSFGTSDNTASDLEREVPDSDISSEEEDRKKKLRSNIIKGIVGVMILWFVADEFLLSPEPEIKLPSKVKSKPVKLVEKTEHVSTPSLEKGQTAENSEAQEVDSDLSQLPSEEVPPVVDSNNLESMLSSETPPTVSETSEPNLGSEGSAVTESEESSEEESFKPIPETPASLESSDSRQEEIGVTSDLLNNKSEKERPSESFSKGEESELLSFELPKSDESELSKVIDELSAKVGESSAPKNSTTQEILPPSYLALGRGLVYNCAGKHWACVDRDSYLQCKKSFDYEKGLRNKVKCVPVAVYADDKSCKIIQVHNINSKEPTAFCE